MESPIRLATPDIIGRDAEMTFLRSALAAARDGRGAAVFLSGEPGLGKTRLVREVAHLASTSAQVVLRGRATSRSAPFRALAEALSSVLRHTGLPDTAELAPYRHALSRLVPEWRMHRVPGADDSLVVLAEAVLRLLHVVGRTHGCVLLLDDLHEADAETLTVVDYLVDNLAGEPVVLVGTARPEPGPAIDLFHAAHRRGVAAVSELAPLDDQQVHRLVAGCLGLEDGHPRVEALARLVGDGEGNPFYIEELLADLIDQGTRPDGRQTAVRGVPAAVLASVTARVARLGAAGPRVLRAAAVFGQRFPVPLVRDVAGVDDTVLTGVLRSSVDAHLVKVEDDDSYAFRHALTADALREGLLPHERVALAARAAAAIEAAYPELPGEWCLVAGELWERAGNRGRAAELLGRAGRRAAAEGGLRTAIALLERSLGLSGDSRALPPDRVSTLESLLDALVAAGQVVRATELGARFDLAAVPRARAMVHLRLARAAAAAGQWDVGQRELDLARKLVDDTAGPDATAPIDVVAAQLAFIDPELTRLEQAEELAARALRAATRTDLPEIACESLEVLGTCARVRDLAEAEVLFRRALDLAERHDLAVWRIRLLFHLGAHAGIRSADPAGLVEARTAARAAGALVTALDIVAELAVVHLTRGEYAEAERNARECEETARRLRLGEMRLTVLGLRVCVSAHRGRRAEAQTLLAEYERLGGADSDFASAVWGFGMVFCSLLEEDRPRALAECERAVSTNRPPQYVSYVHGPRLLLAVLDGTEDRTGLDAAWCSASGQARWNRVFLALAEGVLAGRDGRLGDADRAIAEFEAAAAPFPLAHHLGLRLLGEVAVDGGWGEPARWLRAAEEYFHRHPAPRVVAACRALLRRAGASVQQRREGTDAVPATLRLAGVTAREYEVLALVAQRLTNREISERLVVSRRTVDTHVAKLLAKTGQPDRVALARYVRELGEPGDSR